MVFNDYAIRSRVCSLDRPAPRNNSDLVKRISHNGQGFISRMVMIAGTRKIQTTQEIFNSKSRTKAYALLQADVKKTQKA